MSYKLNVLGPPFDLVSPGANTSLTTNIPQYDADPVAPATQSAWVLKSGGVVVTGGGVLQYFHGLSFAVTTTGSAGGGALTYQFSYRTLENTTKRATIS
jgi:hypothetical protein